MRKILLALGIMALICTPAMAGPNANGAIIVHTNDTYTYRSTTVCTTTLGQPASCAEAVTMGTNDIGQVVWFLAAFLPDASPRVASVFFGMDYNLPAGFVDRQGFCGPAGSVEITDAGWPSGTTGSSVGFGTPIIGNTLFRFYYFVVADEVTTGASLCSKINPTGGYAAYYDDAFPPAQDNITLFGCVNWYQAGLNHCPEIIVTSGACCFPTGDCSVLPADQCAAAGGAYVGDDTTCLPINPCGQPGACCDPETGICRLVLEAQCLAPFHFLDGPCEPVNPCPQKGACCEPVTGVCTFVLADACLAPNVFHPEWTCNPNNCPVEAMGACCDPAGICIMVYQAQCVAPSIWHPELTCEPTNPCQPVATEPTTWGQIKANYR